MTCNCCCGPIILGVSLQMVRNEALLILRRKKRWSFIDNLSDLLTKRLVDQLEQEDTHRAVWLALRNLPIEQRKCSIEDLEELTFAEIGEVLSVPAATAASRYRYALRNWPCNCGTIRRS